MGNTKSKHEYEVVDYAVNRNYSEEQNISEWADLGTPIKNYNYYLGAAFTTLLPLHGKGFFLDYEN